MTKTNIITNKNPSDLIQGGFGDIKQFQAQMKFEKKFDKMKDMTGVNTTLYKNNFGDFKNITTMPLFGLIDENFIDEFTGNFTDVDNKIYIRYKII